MSTLNTQELQIIQAFASADVPENIIRNSNIKDLIRGMTSEQSSVQSDAQRLERLRQEQKEGNFFGNLWNDRDEKVQDAQINLNKSIGRLTQKSSQLLIVNTAISKVLSDQQRVLLEQQKILKSQTDTLKEQNHKIFEQQKLLEKQQQDINKANQGLMEAKGITQEQAQQLVGCVKLVKEAEIRIEATNKDLQLNVKKSLDDSVEQCLMHLTRGLAEQNQRHGAFEQQLTSAFSSQSKNAQDEMDRFSSSTSEFKVNIEQRLQGHIQTILEKTSAQDTATQQLSEAVNLVELKQVTIQQEQTQALQAMRESLDRNLQHLSADLSGKTEALKNAEIQLAAIQTEQLKIASSNRLVLSSVIGFTLAYIGWQVAQQLWII